MKNGLQPGATCARTLTVDRQRTIDFLGESLRIYATPELVRDIEQTCLDFVQGFLDDGESSVGAEVSVQHTGATPLGGEVRIHAEITAVHRRSVTFSVTSDDEVQPVCSCTHRRFIVDVERLRARVQKKTASMPAVA